MKLIIDIPENVIEGAKSSPNYYPTYHFEKIWRAIANGTPYEERPRTVSREADRWILVSEKLPDKEGRCIVSTDYGDVAMDSFVDGMFVLNLGNVVAWKPLPELYKKSEDK